MKCEIKEDYHIDQCPTCGTIYAVADILVEIQKKNELAGDRVKPIRCPNGHAIVYRAKKPESEPLTGEDLEKARAEVLKLRHEREQLEAQIAALRTGGATPRRRRSPKAVSSTAPE